MNTTYPRMLYKAGGDEEIHGGRFATLIVNDEDAEAQALADGWHLTTPEAALANKPDAKDDASDNAAPTRDELKQKATELGLVFAGNISNAKLAEMIEAALANKG